MTDAINTKNNDVYEPSDAVVHHNPYDLKAGGKPACTLADGTVPKTMKQAASSADGPAGSDTPEDNSDNDNIPTKASKVDEIKAYLDAKGVSYDGVTRKDDLLALIPE